MVIILGNKVDKMAERQISIEEGKEFADEHSTLFMETSALPQFHKDVKKAFQTLVTILADEMTTAMERKMTQQMSMAESEIIKLKENVETKKTCC